MPSQRTEIQAHAAENAKGAVKSLSGIALCKQRDNVGVAFIAQRRFDVISTANHLPAVLLREVKIFQFRVHLNKGCSNPMLERFRSVAHSGLINTTVTSRPSSRAKL